MIPPRITYPREAFSHLLAAYEAGRTVYWKSELYKITGKGTNLCVTCVLNNSAIGLFHACETKSSHDPNDFIIQ